MPAWSPEIANDFIRLAVAENRALDQSQLQKLVYIAHGWCLALFDQPLTGDRPEAWEFGPVYRRLADALAPYGRTLVTREIRMGDIRDGSWIPDGGMRTLSELDAFERDLIASVYQEYGSFGGCRLSALTRRGVAPWAQVYADGAGEFRDIPHDLVKAQFVELARQSDRRAADR